MCKIYYFEVKSLLQAITKVRLGHKIKLKWGKNRKICNINENSQVGVLKLHEYVIYFGTRRQLCKIYCFEIKSLLQANTKVRFGHKIKLKWGEKRKMGNTTENIQVTVLKLHE